MKKKEKMESPPKGLWVSKERKWLILFSIIFCVVYWHDDAFAAWFGVSLSMVKSIVIGACLISMYFVMRRFAQKEKILQDDALVESELTNTLEEDNSLLEEQKKQLQEKHDLNMKLLNAIPHPAMLIRDNDKIVLHANKKAVEQGVHVNGYCWREFGKEAFLSEEQKVNSGLSVEGIKCTFCRGLECFTENPYQNNPDIVMDGKHFDTYWIKVDEDIYLHYVVDITEQKLLQEQIREKDIQFGNLSKNIEDLMYMFKKNIDGSYCVPIASEGIKNIFGCSPEDVADTFDAIEKVLHPDDAARVIADIEDSAEHLTKFICEFRACGGQLGKDILFDETEFKNGQKLVTKLWNAFQFVKMQLADADIPTLMSTGVKNIYPTDQRILIRLNETIAEMKKSLDKYEYGAAKIKFDEFFWKDFCDMYLEMIKVRLYQPERFENGAEKKASGQRTLYTVFDAIVKLIAPYLPHITEEIYQDYFKAFEGKISLHVTSYPEEIEHIGSQNVEEAKNNFVKIIDVVEAARKYKTEKQISMGAELQKVILSGPKDYLDMIGTYMDDITGVTKAMNVQFVEQDELAVVIEN